MCLTLLSFTHCEAFCSTLASHFRFLPGMMMVSPVAGGQQELS